MMARSVPVVEVNRDNLKILFPSIVLKIRSSSFIAVDAELSGLGDRKRLNAKSITDRYKSISEAARSRSIISLGLCCFTAAGESDKKDRNENRAFITDTYNFLALCNEDFVVEPGSVQFLVDHGFDFNLQYAKGLPYRRGFGDPMKERKDFTLNDLFWEILTAKKPMVFHNGLVDLVFLYGSFVADLPPSFETFMADIVELFPGAVYDTKYVADYCARYSSSYLEYTFRKCQRENEREAAKGRAHVTVQLPSFTPSVEKWIEWASFSVPSGVSDNTINVCPIFAAHGWCKYGRDCESSHDVDAVLDKEEKKSSKKPSKRRRNNTSNVETGSVTDDDLWSTPLEQRPVEIDDNAPDRLVSAHEQGKSLPLYNGAHRAGYDAFMTAFSFACFTSILKQWPSDMNTFDVPMFKNKMALSGKDTPLLVQESRFSKPSQTVKRIMRQMF